MRNISKKLAIAALLLANGAYAVEENGTVGSEPAEGSGVQALKTTLQQFMSKLSKLKESAEKDHILVIKLSEEVGKLREENKRLQMERSECQKKLRQLDAELEKIEKVFNEEGKNIEELANTMDRILNEEENKRILKRVGLGAGQENEAGKNAGTQSGVKENGA